MVHTVSGAVNREPTVEPAVRSASFWVTSDIVGLPRLIASMRRDRTMRVQDIAFGPAQRLSATYTGKPVSDWGGLVLLLRYL